MSPPASSGRNESRETHEHLPRVAPLNAAHGRRSAPSLPSTLNQRPSTTYLLIPKRLDERRQPGEVRFQIFLIIPPAADGAVINGLGHIRVSGRTDEFLSRMFIKAQYP